MKGGKGLKIIVKGGNKKPQIGERGGAKRGGGGGGRRGKEGEEREGGEEGGGGGRRGHILVQSVDSTFLSRTALVRRSFLVQCWETGSMWGDMGTGSMWGDMGTGSM